MKEKLEVTWEELQELMNEERSVTKREFCITVMLAFLYGMVLGIFFSPKKHVTIGSNNTSYSSQPEECGKDKDRKKEKRCCAHKHEEQMI